jgi:hypothetical protein
MTIADFSFSIEINALVGGCIAAENGRTRCPIFSFANS